MLRGTDIYSYNQIGDGRRVVAVTDTAVQLSGTSTPCSLIVVSALPSNGETVVVGGSGVVATTGSETGKILYPGDSESFYVDNLDKLYVNGTATKGVTYVYYK